jgi:hypothetical protein
MRFLLMWNQRPTVDGVKGLTVLIDHADSFRAIRCAVENYTNLNSFGLADALQINQFFLEVI